MAPVELVTGDRHAHYIELLVRAGIMPQDPLYAVLVDLHQLMEAHCKAVSEGARGLTLEAEAELIVRMVEAGRMAIRVEASSAFWRFTFYQAAACFVLGAVVLLLGMVLARLMPPL